MPPNEVTVDEVKPAPEVESATAELETADQKAEEATQHSIFRENAHQQPEVENQKIIPNIPETTPIPQATTETETGLFKFKLSLLIEFKFLSRSPSAEEPTTKTSVLQKVEHAGERVTIAIADKTGLPTWGVVAIIILVFLVVFGIIFFCVRRFLKKRRTKDGKGKKGVDMKSVQLLGSAYKEKVSIKCAIKS